MAVQAGWAVTGTLASGLSQWVIIAVLARASGTSAVGGYSLALAITAPAFTFSMMQLRALLVTTAAPVTTLRPYLFVRAVTSTAMALLMVAVASFVPGQLAVFLVPLTLARAVESLGDIYLGSLQRAGLMDVVGKCQTCAMSVPVAAFAITLGATGSPQAATWSLAGSALLAGLTIPAVAHRIWMTSPAVPRTGAPLRPTALLRAGFPLGLSSTVTSASVSTPRVVLQAWAGIAAVGTYAASAQVVQGISSVVGAASQAGLPAMSEAFHRGGASSLLAATRRALGWCLALGAALVLGATLSGPAFLTLLYGPAFSQPPLICALFAASGAIASLTWFLDQALVIAGRRKSQLAVNLVGLVFVVVVGVVLVPHHGVRGAVAATVIAFGVQASLKYGVLMKLPHVGRQPS